MRNALVKETPLYEVTLDEIKSMFRLVYMFLIDKKNAGIGGIHSATRSGLKSPGWAAGELLYLALYGYTKKRKFSRVCTFSKWINPPKTLEARILVLLGNEGRAYYRKQQLAAAPGDPTELEDVAVDIPIKETREPMSRQKPEEGFIGFNEAELTRRMAKYIEDFDLHSSVDQDILRNLVLTQLLIEREQKKVMSGGTIQESVLKSLSEQAKNYIAILGLSKKDRMDLGAEKQKGSIAELTLLYEETLENYVEMEQDFLAEELEMLLNKYDRANHDGERELTAKDFKIISGGYSVEEAREYLGRPRKHVKKPKYTSDT